MSSPTRLRFGPYSLDVELCELRRGGELVRIKPKPFDLLCFLTTHRDRIVTKEELMEELWNGTVVGESSVTMTVSAVRTALRDSPREPRWLATVWGRGYRFIGDVREEESERPSVHEAIGVVAPRGQGLEPSRRDCSRSRLALAPAVAVLPFEDLTPEPRDAYFCPALTQDTITRLSLWRLVRVLSRGSTARYERERPSPRQIGDELGASYLVEGSVRRSSERVLVQTHLVDCDSGVLLWEAEYREPLGDILDVQDEISRRLASQLRPHLLEIETRRLAQRDPTTFSAWDLALRGFWHLERCSQVDNAEAQRLFRESARLNPAFVLPHYGLALSHDAEIDFQWTPDPDRARAALQRAATQAMQIDPLDFRALTLHGFSAMISGEARSARGAFEAAVDENPSAIHPRILLGQILTLGGECAPGIEVLEEAARLTPGDPERWRVVTALGIARFVSGDYAAAAAAADEAISSGPTNPIALAVRVSASSHLGNGADAATAVLQLRANVPRFSSDHWAPLLEHVAEADRARFVEGLQRAGL